MILEKYKNKRVAIIGFGVSNAPLLRLLCEVGATVSVRDKKEVKLSEQYDGVRLITGEGYLDGLDEEVIFKTPGLRADTEQLLRAKAAGAYITSEMSEFFRLCPCRIIGVTGSDGKTTTTTIISEMLKKQGHKCYIGGNIGTPLLDKTNLMTASDIAVLELSSFQLMDMKQSPHTAVITNIAPNHLDMHKSMEEYIQAKRNIIAYGAQRIVLNHDNDITRTMSENAIFFSRKRSDTAVHLRDGIIYYNDTPLVDTREILIPGDHNIENYMAAIGAVHDIVTPDAMRSVAREFGGVSHRCELVRTHRQVRYYNDSIASSPTRTIAGLRAFPQKVILIAGGYDKNIPFDVLGPEIVKYVKALVLTGNTAEKIRLAVESAPGGKAVPISLLPDFDSAVAHAAEIALPGDIVTLSPACASFDMFENFEQRGNRFKELVNRLQ